MAPKKKQKDGLTQTSLTSFLAPSAGKREVVPSTNPGDAAASLRKPGGDSKKPPQADLLGCTRVSLANPDLRLSEGGIVAGGRHCRGLSAIGKDDPVQAPYVERTYPAVGPNAHSQLRAAKDKHCRLDSGGEELDAQAGEASAEEGQKDVPGPLPTAAEQDTVQPADDGALPEVAEENELEEQGMRNARRTAEVQGALQRADDGALPEAAEEDGLKEGDMDNAFEKEREERMRRNQMMLMQLGIQSAAASVRPRPAQTGVKRKSCRRQPFQPTHHNAAPQRRSARLTGSAADGPKETGAPEVPKEEEAEEAVYVESDVLRYVCCDSPPEAGKLDTFTDGQRLTGFSASQETLYDAKQTRAYGMDTNGKLLVAGGHQGWMSIWGLGIAPSEGGEDAPRDPLMSAKLHSGWICDVQFLSSAGPGAAAGGGSTLLLSASNDAIVALWDVSKAAGGKPLKLLESREVHQGGIFSMHAMGTSILTASKDSSVAVSDLNTEGCRLSVTQRYEFHHGVVKCTRWRDAHVFASGGNDRAINVCDVRSKEANPCASIADAHVGAVNYLRWSPASENLILSSGADDAIQVYDIRSSRMPVMTFRGHNMRKGSHIYQPLWGDGGNCVISGGDTGLLSVYCCKTGQTVSRGEIGFEPKATGLADPEAHAGSTLFLATTKQILTFRPMTMP